MSATELEIPALAIEARVLEFAAMPSRVLPRLWMERAGVVPLVRAVVVKQVLA